MNTARVEPELVWVFSAEVTTVVTSSELAIEAAKVFAPEFGGTSREVTYDLLPGIMQTSERLGAAIDVYVVNINSVVFASSDFCVILKNHLPSVLARSSSGSCRRGRPGGKWCGSGKFECSW